MGKLVTIGNVVIRIYPNDHAPPHFHAIAPDGEALIEIATLSISRGALPPPARRAVVDWASAHRDQLVAEWNRINPRLPIGWKGSNDVA